MAKYIGHARSNSDHKAGDSSGKEVLVSKFTYSKSSTSVYNWTYVFRPVKNADKMASMCEKACANNYIGYCSTATKTYGKNAPQLLAKKVGYDLSKIKTKTGLSCGDLICLCSRYAGLSKVYLGSALPLASALKQNPNYKCIKYSYGMALKRGDVLITAHSNGKNNHVVMYLGATYPCDSLPTLPKRKYFKIGDQGVGVKRLQKLIAWMGIPVNQDGVYGVATAEAVKKFQAKYGLVVDGEFGEKSLAKAKKIKR